MHLHEDLKEIIPKGNKRMGSNPNANGGLLLKELNIPIVIFMVNKNKKQVNEIKKQYLIK